MPKSVSTDAIAAFLEWHQENVLLPADYKDATWPDDEDEIKSAHDAITANEWKAEIAYLGACGEPGGPGLQLPLETASETKSGAVAGKVNGTAKLRRYWTVGEGGIRKIRWGVPGDGKRCIRHLSKYIGPMAPGYCQNLHRAMNGGAVMGQGPGEKKVLTDKEKKTLEAITAMTTPNSATYFRVVDSDVEYKMPIMEDREVTRRTPPAAAKTPTTPRRPVSSAAQQRQNRPHDGKRRVVTPEGARRYGVPVGSVIERKPKKAKKPRVKKPKGTFHKRGTGDQKRTPKTLTKPGTVIAVKRGDTLWALAQRHLGDGRRWKELGKQIGITTEAQARRMRVGAKFKIPGTPTPAKKVPAKTSKVVAKPAKKPSTTSTTAKPAQQTQPTAADMAALQERLKNIDSVLRQMMITRNFMV